MKKYISLFLCLTLWSCKTSQSLPQASETIPVREIIHAVLDYRYSEVIIDPTSDRGRMLDSMKLTQIDQQIHFWGGQYYINATKKLESEGVWDDKPMLTLDSTMIVNLGNYTYTTPGGVTVYFKDIDKMSHRENQPPYYLAFTPPAWDAEKKRFCGFMKLTYGEVHLYAVERKGEKYECIYTVFYHS